MGSVYKSFCACGYTSDVTVGGSRGNFLEESWFPFYCEQCGLVSVNIAQLPDNQVVTKCPTCQTKGCTQYGVPPVSTYDLRDTPWWRRLFTPRTARTESPTSIQWGNRKASEEGHRCPACREMSLRFSRSPSLMFD